MAPHIGIDEILGYTPVIAWELGLNVLIQEKVEDQPDLRIDRARRKF